MNNLLEEINQELADIRKVDIDVVRQIKECGPDTICIYGGDEDLQNENDIVSLYKDYKYLNFLGHLKTLMFTSATRRPANILSFINNIRGKKCLDFGSGVETHAMTMSKNGNDVSILDVEGPLFDFAKERLRRRGLKFNSYNHDASLPSNEFDVIVCLDVLEHVYDPVKELKRIINALKPGGILCLEVSVMVKKTSGHFQQSIEQWKEHGISFLNGGFNQLEKGIYQKHIKCMSNVTAQEGDGFSGQSRVNSQTHGQDKPVSKKIKPMKIIYFSDNYTWTNWGTKRSIYEEIKLRGHEVIWLDKCLLKVSGTLPSVAAHPIFQLCAEHKPDQIWLSHSNLQLPLEVKNALNMPVLGFGFSDPYYFSEDRFKSYDAYITNHYETLLQYRDKIPMHYNPTACDRNYHKKMDIARDIDVSIIGRGEHLRFEDRFERIKIADMLRAQGIRVAAFGDEWPEHPDNYGAISGDTFREVICRSKIGLDVQDIDSPLAHRMLEYGACGIPVITRRRPEVYRLFGDDEILAYTNHQDLLEMVKYYLANDDQRSAAAEKLYNRCTQSHDIANRVDGILGFAETVFKQKVAQLEPIARQTAQSASSALADQLNIDKNIGKLSIGKGCKISEQAYIGYQEHGGSIEIGDTVRINHGAVLRTCTGEIKIGNRVSIACTCILHAQGGI
ncbi:MAG: glycosyltransferase family protein, partial [Planctomycetota bacterium]